MNPALRIHGEEELPGSVRGQGGIVLRKLRPRIRHGQPLAVKAQLINPVKLFGRQVMHHPHLLLRLLNVAPQVTVEAGLNVGQLVQAIEAVRIIRGLSEATPVKRQPVGSRGIEILLESRERWQLPD